MIMGPQLVEIDTHPEETQQMQMNKVYVEII